MPEPEDLLDVSPLRSKVTTPIVLSDVRILIEGEAGGQVFRFRTAQPVTLDHFVLVEVEPLPSGNLAIGDIIRLYPPSDYYLVLSSKLEPEPSDGSLYTIEQCSGREL